MNIVILAAGQGKRMRSDLPKVLHPLAGKPLLRHVIDCARSLSPQRLIVVHGHGGDTVRQAIDAALPGNDIGWALQSPQLGTGHAVMQAAPLLDPTVPTLVLYGDVPLTTRDTLVRLIEAAGPDRLALLTVNLDDPTGYGRIVRHEGRIVRIVEHKDADEPTRGIDVGSVEYIHERIVEKRDEGVGVLLVSSELDEIMSLSDRIAVMYEGRIVDIVNADEVSREEIGLMMAGARKETVNA